MAKLTELESKVLAICEEVYDYAGCGDDVARELKDELTAQQVGGVLSSLVKKGVIEIDPCKVDDRVIYQVTVV